MQQATELSFIARVELHGASDSDYDVLHDEMEKRGFFRKIRDREVIYHLPHAEYVSISTGPLTEATDRVAAAAKATGRDHGIVVSKVASMEIRGLRRVNE
jgi:hypothetical protein